MNNLEKIQKTMRVLRMLCKILSIFACAGAVLASIAAILVAADVLNAGNQFLHFLSATAGIRKGQLVGVLTAAACSLLIDGMLAVFACRYFTAELKEGTPFTNTGADRIKSLGIMTIVLSIVSACITDGIYGIINLAGWDRFDGAAGVTLGICLLLLVAVARYGAELEHQNKEKKIS